MNEAASTLLYALGRTSVWLSLAGLLVWVLLRCLSCRSPAVHRVAWAGALLTGWLFIRVPVTVPWYEAQPRRATLPLTTSDLVEAGQAAPVVPVAVAQPSTTAPSPTLIDAAGGGAGMNVPWPLLLVGGWVLGVLAIVAWWLASYVRFVCQLPYGVPPRDEWAAEWQAMLAEAENRSLRVVRLRVVPAFGPAVCRMGRGHVLFVPAELWGELTSPERKAVLRHELAHLRRRDLEWSLAARFVALAHWFNPVCWWAVGNFDEAGEWACDDAVHRRDAAEAVAYGRLLLRLGQAEKPLRWVAAIGGRRLSTRIKRALSGDSFSLSRDSTMKKAVLVCSLGTLVLLAAVEWRLGVSAARAVDQEVEPSRGQLKVDRVLLERMVASAAKTFEASKASYEVGTEIMANVYVWSRRWLEAERALAQTDDEEIAALEAHRQRMKQLMLKLRALHATGTKGGESERFNATKFYLAEADAWLWTAKHRGLDEPPPLANVSFLFRGPDDLSVRWDEDNDVVFDKKPTACPVRHKFLEGGIYFLEFSGLGGLELNATLEVTAASDREIVIELSVADIKQIASDHVLSKAYVMTSKSGVDEVSNWDEVRGMNDRGKLMAEAERKGKVLAVVRIGKWYP